MKINSLLIQHTLVSGIDEGWLAGQIAARLKTGLITIFLTLSSATISTCATAALDPDIHEPDDSQEQATLVATDGEAQRHNSHAEGDADWVRFYAEAGKELIIRADNLESRGIEWWNVSDLVLTLSDAGGVILTQDGPLAADSEEIVWIVPVDGYYYVKVAQFDASLVSDYTHYDLRIYQWNPLTDPDLYEPDNQASQATDIIPADIPQIHNHHIAGDGDWFIFDAVVGETDFYGFVFEYSETDSAPILTLFDTDAQTLLLQARSSSNVFGTLWKPPVAGSYFLKVNQYDSSIFGDPTRYDISIKNIVVDGFPLNDLEVSHLLYSEATVGVPFELTLTVEVTGFDWDNEIAANVLTQTTLPDSVTLADALPEKCSLVIDVVSCDLGDLPQNSSATRTFSLVASSTTGIHFTSTVFSYADVEHTIKMPDEYADNDRSTLRIVPLAMSESSTETPEGAFAVDTSSDAPITGLWWNANESGWGVTLTQQFNVIFATIFTYDTSGSPIWYVVSNCAITDNQCSGGLYEVSGGSAVSETWDGRDKSTTKVGSVTVVFQDNDNAVLNLTVNGVTAQIAITRQVFSLPSPDATMSALWWNANESGWGVTLTEQMDVVFAALFTYQSGGSPIWYVASNCVISGNGCSGALYKVTNGTVITDAWDGSGKLVSEVGEVSFDFPTTDRGTMTYVIDGIAGSKEIEKQVWATQ